MQSHKDNVARWCVAGLSSHLSGQDVQSCKADGLPGLPLEETESPDGLMWIVTGPTVADQIIWVILGIDVDG